MVQAAGERWLSEVWGPSRCSRADLSLQLTDLLWGAYAAQAELR
jgi:hypothetical protein